MDQDGANDGGRGSFRDRSLDLICSRHESFLAVEVSRVLAPGRHVRDPAGRLPRQRRPGPDTWNRDAGGAGQLDRAGRATGHRSGLVIEEAARADQRIRFDDIAAVVFYLKAVSWSIPGYSLEKYRDPPPPPV